MTCTNVILQLSRSNIFNPLCLITETIRLYIILFGFTYIKLSNYLNAHIDAVHGASAGYINKYITQYYLMIVLLHIACNVISLLLLNKCTYSVFQAFKFITIDGTDSRKQLIGFTYNMLYIR